MEQLQRPALHARSLAFDHPVNRKRMYFEVQPPTDFDAVLKGLQLID